MIFGSAERHEHSQRAFLQIRYVGLSNETPYGLAKFLEHARGGKGDGEKYPKVQAVQVRDTQSLCYLYEFRRFK